MSYILILNHLEWRNTANSKYYFCSHQQMYFQGDLKEKPFLSFLCVQEGCAKMMTTVFVQTQKYIENWGIDLASLFYSHHLFFLSGITTLRVCSQHFVHLEYNSWLLRKAQWRDVVSLGALKSSQRRCSSPKMHIPRIQPPSFLIIRTYQQVMIIKFLSFIFDEIIH